VRLRITKVDEYQFLSCLKNSLWGSRSARFKDWQKGDYIAFIVDKTLAGYAEMSGEYYRSNEQVWDNGLFPWRIPIKFHQVLAKSDRIPILGEIRDVLISAWGNSYGWGILNQSVLTNSAANKVLRAFSTRPNNLVQTQSNIQQLLEDAKQQRENPKIKKDQRTRSSKVETEPTLEKFTTEEDSIHSKAQNALIKLGKTGCSVWVASNDRNRSFHGKTLGDECLKQLPNLGLSDEATRKISLIDIIWIKQNAPVCAFEVETTTSIYSGILRMSDLISVVPALNVKLYIVAPRERQESVRRELTRQTFRKIGLNDFCRFISIEELNDLLSKVEGFGGHIQPSIIDKISVGFGEEI
jgi:hypothetical protein